MSRINRPKLSLVGSTPTRVPPSANQVAASPEVMPEGWFCDEVGYVGETTVGARVLTLASSPRLD